MRIAITGAHRVGKTSIVNQLQKSLPDYKCNNEPYYELEGAGQMFSDTPNVQDFISQCEYSIRQISALGDRLIFDRCPIDFLAYIKAMDEHYNIRELYTRAQEALSKIDLLVFVAIEEPDLIFCPADELPELRNQVNEILNEWIWDLDIAAIEVHGTVLSRRNQILEKMSGL